MTRRLLAALLCLGLVTVFGCSRLRTSPSTVSQTDAGQKPDPTKLNELKIVDKLVGKGPAAEDGDMVFVTYTGKLKNGNTFDTNKKPSGSPYSFTVGGANVIPGWDKGIVGMRVGGERHLDIPAKLAYGDSAPPGGQIPPGSDLNFDLQLHDLIKKGDEDIVDVSPHPNARGRLSRNEA